VFGANGGIQIEGIADADMISAAFADNATVIEQHDSVNQVVGMVAHNQRDDFTLTFYPLPGAAAVSTTKGPVIVDQLAASFQAIKLPQELAQVYVWRRVPGANSPAQLPTRVAEDVATAKTYRYIGGGTMALTANGLMIMTLPLRKWALLT
jgi:hypothetical protein